MTCFLGHDFWSVSVRGLSVYLSELGSLKKERSIQERLWLFFMLSRILLRMAPPAFVLALSLTSLVYIQVTAESEQGGSSGTITSLLPMGGDESETDWLDRFPISSGSKVALFLGITFGALIGFLVRGWWGILVGAGYRRSCECHNVE
ncbi:hypothetical protein [Pasteuria penetrans]|uniref:hypothetical protein n=1 Tax=Pasteuria penetrans TaxID=86005 RepID=UPI0011ED6E7B|nr:hypothetical protein [Pasteuria penetrans]